MCNFFPPDLPHGQLRVADLRNPHSSKMDPYMLNRPLNKNPNPFDSDATARRPNNERAQIIVESG
jgi:hypothetical protein